MSRGKGKKGDQGDLIACILEEPDGSSKDCRKNWARLIQKIYEMDLLTCPKCQGRMRIISFIEDEEVIKKIPKHLELWDVKARPPPRANSPPESSEQYVDYSDSQIPVSEGHLYMDMDYPEAVIS